MIPASGQFDEYSLPGDEKHEPEWDTNVQFDWHRHLPKSEQERLGPDPAKAFAKRQKELDLEHMAEGAQ